MPYVMRVAAGQLEVLSVFGTDYDTKDGTGPDYIHVVDLAEGHVAALEALHPGALWEKRPLRWSLGSGWPPVLELVSAFERASNRLVPGSRPRRAGDLPSTSLSLQKLVLP